MYHGGGTAVPGLDLARNDVVLTTYETVLSDIAKKGTLQSISWFRIVLDEGK